MNDFYFYNPVKVLFGKDQLKNLPGEVAVFGKKVLFVYGGESIKKTGVYDIVTGYLKDFTVFELGGVEPNPDVVSVRKGAKICKKEGIDLVLAVGGGSVIDASKWIAAAACVEHDAWDFFCKRTTIDDALPLITVLTMAATGSEMNNGGVISNRAELKKIGRSSPKLFPKVSFLNPEFTYTVGPYQTACGAVDIISHVMEVYFHNQEGLCLLDRIMESLIETVIEYGPKAIENPHSYEARANLMWAASWAINGLINGPVRQGWNCHTIEHELSARFGITHGHGLAILIPRWLRYCYSDQNKQVYKRFAERILGIRCGSEEEMLETMTGRLEQLFFEVLGLDSGLSDLGISHEEIRKTAQSVCGNGVITGFAELNEDDVLKILEMCY